MAYDTVISNKIEYDTKDSQKGVDNLTSKLKNLASAAAIAFATKKIFEFGTAFESTFAKASTLIDNTVVDMAGLEDQILDLSKTSGVAADELNESLYQALSAGVPITEDGADAMAFLERNIQLAKGGFTDLTTAVDTTTTVINAYGKDLSETNQITDVLIKTQNAGKTTVNELGTALANVIPTAAAMNVEFEQVGSAMAALTAQGIPTAQAATQLQRLFAELGKSGTKASNILLEISGKSFQELIAEGKTVADILALMDNHAKENNITMLDMFSSIQAGQGALALTGEGALTFNDALETMTDGVDATNEAFETMNETTSEQLNIAMNQLKVAAIEVFLAIAPLITAVLEFVNANNLLIPILGTLVAVLTLAKVAQIALNIAMYANPIGLVILAIVALIAAGVLLVKNWGLVTAFFADMWEGIKTIFKGGVNGIISILNLLPKLWEFEINLVIDGLNLLIDQMNKIPGINLGKIQEITLPKIPKLAKGGLAFGETQAIVGDNPNAATDPEVIAPLSRLRKMFNQNSSQQSPQVIQLVVDSKVLTEIMVGRSNDVMAANYGVKTN